MKKLLILCLAIVTAVVLDCLWRKRKRQMVIRLK